MEKKWRWEGHLSENMSVDTVNPGMCGLREPEVYVLRLRSRPAGLVSSVFLCVISVILWLH